MLGGAQARNERNATVIRKLHHGGVECHAGGGDASSVPQTRYPSREDAPLAAAADSSRQRVRRAL
jgi:hypothetical protein